MIGDHIRARKGGRWTHAIDCGDQTVIFLREDEGLAPADRILRSYRPTFEAEAEAVEVVTHRERVFPPRQVVARAYSRTRDPAVAAMFGDSEAFAEWCKTGRVLNGAYNYAVAVPGAPAAPRAKTNGAAVAKQAPAKAAAAKAKAKAAAGAAKVKVRPAAVKAKAKAKPAPVKTTAKAAKSKVAAKGKPAARKAKVVAKAVPKAGAKAKPIAKKKAAPPKAKAGARKAAGAKRR